MTELAIELTLNGTRRTVRTAPNKLLINLLHEDLGLTGAKYGCGIGECGACTVLIDGEPAMSCLTLVASLHGKSVLTIEGLGRGGLDPLQEAFLDHAATQCGFCTPGMIMTAKSLLNENENPSEEEIREYMRGNICRCTGYVQIVRAIKSCVPRQAAAKHLG